MKKIKISLTVIVVGVIAYFILRDCESPEKVSKISNPTNQFVELIEKKIDSIELVPDNTFSTGLYREIKYEVENFYKEGRLGNNPSENKQWNENLSKKLYSAYANKFITQVFYVFRGSDWDINDLHIIRGELQTLRSSSLLERNSPVDKKFEEIKNIFGKYDEITGFIANSNNFTFKETSIDSHFPVEYAQNQISRVDTYLRNGLENEYINHCLRLHNGLKEISQVFFRTHIAYLDNKINFWSGVDIYKQYASYNDYSNNLNLPLKKEINALNNVIYKADENEFSKIKSKLSKSWSDENLKAYKNL